MKMEEELEVTEEMEGHLVVAAVDQAAQEVRTTSASAPTTATRAPR